MTVYPYSRMLPIRVDTRPAPVLGCRGIRGLFFASVSEVLFVSWVWLLLASASEIVWAVGLKLSEGFTRFWPSVITVVFMIVSYVFLGQALKGLPLGTAYAIWTGIGAVGAGIAGALLFKEPVTAARVLFFGLIVIGIVGLQATTRA